MTRHAADGPARQVGHAGVDRRPASRSIASAAARHRRHLAGALTRRSSGPDARRERVGTGQRAGEVRFSRPAGAGVSTLHVSRARDRGLYVGFTDRPAFANAREIAQDLVTAYVDGEVDKVEIIYDGYVSTLTQEVRRETLLPLQQATILEGAEEESDDGSADEDEGGGRALVGTSPTRTRSSGASSGTSRSPSTRARSSSPPRPSTARA